MAKEARLDLGIGNPSTIKELADILVYCQGEKYIAYKETNRTGEKITLTARLDPFVEVLTAFGFERNCRYFTVKMSGSLWSIFSSSGVAKGIGLAMAV